MNTDVTTKLEIHTPAEDVFEAIVDPVKIGNFWFSSSSERWEQGKSVTLRYEEYQAEGVIHVLEIEKNKKIKFSWGSEHDAGTTVTITLNEQDNKTIIEVNESGLREDDPEIVNKMMGQKEGWVYTLSCLKAYVEHGVKDMRASLIH